MPEYDDLRARVRHLLRDSGLHASGPYAAPAASLYIDELRTAGATPSSSCAAEARSREPLAVVSALGSLTEQVAAIEAQRDRAFGECSP